MARNERPSARSCRTRSTSACSTGSTTRERPSSASVRPYRGSDAYFRFPASARRLPSINRVLIVSLSRSAVRARTEQTMRSTVAPMPEALSTPSASETTRTPASRRTARTSWTSIAFLPSRSSLYTTRTASPPFWSAARTALLKAGRSVEAPESPASSSNETRSMPWYLHQPAIFSRWTPSPSPSTWPEQLTRT